MAKQMKKNKKSLMPAFFGMIFVCMILIPRLVWAEDTEMSSQDNPSMFIKEGGLPEAASEEIKELIAGGPENMPSVYGLLRASVVSFEDYLVSQLQQKTETIDVLSYGIKKEDVYEAFSAIINQHPELFYVGTYLRWYYNSSGIVTAIIVEYFDYDEEALNAEVDKVLDLVDDNISDLEKVILIHDYLCLDVEYAYEDYLNGTVSSDAHSMKGAVLDKVAVCDGYASAFQYYMLLLDIPCNVITNSSHAWNQVYVDGNWYFIDVTWDDPVWDYYGNVGHKYFMKSKEGFTDHEWETASGYESCDDTRYDSAFWNDVSTQLISHDSEWYYVDSNGDLYRHNFGLNSITESGTFVTSLKATWPVFGSSTSYWSGNFVKIAEKDDLLYYSWPKGIYTCNFDGTEKTLKLEADTSKGYIYGMRILRNRMEYQISTKPGIQQREDNTYIFEKMEQTITVSNANINKTYGDSSFNLGVKASANGELTYSSSNSSVATVSTSGQVTIKGAGSAVITVRAAETFDYKAASKTIQINVDRKNISGTIKLYSNQYVYNGKAKQPQVTIDGLVQNTDYKVSYSNNINIGTAKITVTGTGNYKGTKTKTFQIVPAKPEISAAKSTEAGKIQVKWKKQSCGGYEIVFSANSNFSSVAKRVAVSNSSNVSKTISGFTSGKTYYIKMRAYKTVNGQKYYSAYSQKSSVTVIPEKVNISKVSSAGNGKIQIKWDKQNCSGYEIVFSRSSNFSTVAKRVTVSGSYNISKTISGFTSGKTYYVKIRAYKTVNGQKCYGAYSQKFSVTVR